MADDKNKQFDASARFLRSYLERGFGVLPKKEMDRLIYALLVESGGITNPDDHYTVSRLLKVTPAKAANLAYEHKLHHSDAMSQSELRQQFGELLRQTNLGKARHKVALEVRDRLLREEIEREILRLGLAAPDYSFNRNLLLLDFQTFSALVMAFAGETAMKRIETELRKYKELPSDLPSAQALFAKFIEHAAGRAGEEVTSRLFDLAEVVMTGGIPSILKRALR